MEVGHFWVQRCQGHLGNTGLGTAAGEWLNQILYMKRVSLGPCTEHLEVPSHL